MSYLADDSAAIKARLEEIAAQKRLALTGSTIEEPKETKEFDAYGMYAYPAGYKVYYGD